MKTTKKIMPMATMMAGAQTMMTNRQEIQIPTQSPTIILTIDVVIILGLLDAAIMMTMMEVGGRQNQITMELGDLRNRITLPVAVVQEVEMMIIRMQITVKGVKKGIILKSVPFILDVWYFLWPVNYGKNLLWLKINCNFFIFFSTNVYLKDRLFFFVYPFFMPT